MFWGEQLALNVGSTQGNCSSNSAGEMLTSCEVVAWPAFPEARQHW